MQTKQTNYRSISTIAKVISKEWKDVHNFANPARPYLNAMYSLVDLNDSFYMDPAREIVARFLSNASTWKGETARAIKAELNNMLKNF